MHQGDTRPVTMARQARHGIPGLWQLYGIEGRLYMHRREACYSASYKSV